MRMVGREHGRRLLPGCALLLLVLYSEVAADTASAVTDSTGQRGFVGATMARIGGEFSAQLQYPFGQVRRHPWRSLAVVGGLAAMVSTDHHTLDALARREELEETDLLDTAELMGDLGNTLNASALVVAFGAVGVLADSPRERETAMMLFESVLTSTAWTALIKGVAGRERPVDGDNSASDWSGPARIFEDGSSAGQTHLSFPSGHSTLAWAAATVLANQYSWHGVVPVVAYGSAAAMSYSRMALHRHWLSDVVVGAQIGYGCASQVVSTHRATADATTAAGSQTNWSIAPAGLGVAFEFRF